MGLKLSTDPVAKENFELAKKILGRDVLDIMINGPLEKLSDTKYTQPACLLDGYVSDPDYTATLHLTSLPVSEGLCKFTKKHTLHWKLYR